MNVTQDLSILHLILQASAVVQVVMALLAGVSLMSWYYIFMKLFAVKQARAKTETFERDFWSGGDLNNLYNSAVNDRHHAGSMERIFEAGFREFTKLKGQKNLDPKDIVDGSRRAMRATYQREMDALESHLAFLASVGSVSPYIGLFRRTLIPRTSSTAPAVPCAPLTSAKWMPWSRILPSSLQSVQFLRISACSVPSGASCMLSAACRTSVRPRWLRSPRALPKRWSPRPSACSPPFRPCWPTTASRTTSTVWPPATRALWKSSPIS